MLTLFILATIGLASIQALIALYAVEMAAHFKLRAIFIITLNTLCVSTAACITVMQIAARQIMGG